MVQSCFEREDNNIILKALHFELLDHIGRGRPKQMWKKLVQKEMHKNGLVMKDACDCDKWQEVVISMTIRNPANSVNREETRSKLN